MGQGRYSNPSAGHPAARRPSTRPRRSPSPRPSTRPRRSPSPRPSPRSGPRTRLTRRGRFLVTLLCLVAGLGAAGLAVAAWDTGTGETGKAAPGPAATDGASGGSGEVSRNPPSRDRADHQVPASGTGAFAPARLTGTPVGSGTLRRYQVQVETGSGVAPDQAAAEIQRIVADPRGWARNGRGRFQLVAGKADFVIRVATPKTADRLCAEAHLDTGGELNCETGKGVVVNLKRWLTGSPQFAGTPAEYRHLIINHELGHALGLGHLGCPAPGRPAPVMMQQIKGLGGCRSNAHPYAANGTYLSGPTL
ncbi:DUF3152 domain-containing protein [Streptomyces sp. NBC_00237]|uniref:DUF3152 domain-containing protein n=1 Tax=Streptomyces sp. NBC_00237 TaxID=2975687 RepID=UPI0022526D28|nr:DUF3152 domain-containing protein [Streptomyces sp. NBC_00237]MCX5200309.1 DUF3152 domain-containing protein [Streptomyces sp. NBC_00237]